MAIDLGAFEFDAQTIGLTETDLTSNTTTIQSRTTAGIYQLWLDLNAMTATEAYELTFYEKPTAAGTQRVYHRITFTGAQVEPEYTSPTFLLGRGWTMTLRRLPSVSGTNRAFSWSIRAVT
jgi:hypothetical protein